MTTVPAARTDLHVPGERRRSAIKPNAASAIRECRPPEAIATAGIDRGWHRERKLGSVSVDHFGGARQWSGADDTVCRLVFQCASRSVLSLGGSAPGFDLPAGSWAAQISRAFEIQTFWGSEVIALAFPSDLLSRSVLLQIRTAPEAAIRTAGAAQICLELARACLARTEPVSDAVSATMGDSLVELAKLSIIEQPGGRRGETIRETVRARILGLINRNLTDPDLTIGRIAERMQCTKRYLHKVFSDESETLSQYIWTRRLELCRAHLARPDLADKSITEIAFACGFSNAAHFSRSFRARFGQSPTAFRRTALDS